MDGQGCDDCLGDGSRDSKKRIFNKITEHAAFAWMRDTPKSVL